MTMMAGLMTFALVIILGAFLYVPMYKEHFDRYGVRVKPRKKDELNAGETPKESAILGVAKAVGDMMMTTFPQVADQRTQTLLVHANYRTPEHLATYVGIKTIITGGLSFCFLIASAGNPMQLLFIVPAALVAWMMPNFFLAGRVKKRQSAIVNELPIAIDLLIVCAQAGLGLLMCIDKVGKEITESCPNLSAEFEQLLQDVKIFAKSVGNSLKDMGERCGVDELSAIAASLIAADAKGSDISYPLRQQAEALRDRLKRKKEEEASKTPVKMVPVIMIFVMPLILCPMLGPAVITIMQALGPVFGGTK